MNVCPQRTWVALQESMYKKSAFFDKWTKFNIHRIHILPVSILQFIYIQIQIELSTKLKLTQKVSKSNSNSCH